MSSNQVSETNHFKRPPGEYEKHLAKRVEEIMLPSRLNTLLIRNFRMSVENDLRAEYGPDFAASHWEYFCDFIFKAHFMINHTKRYPDILTVDQLDRVTTKYPTQLKKLVNIEEMIMADKTLDQIIAVHEL